MTGTTILDKFNSMVENELTGAFKLQLANDAIHEMEMELQLEINKKVNTSNSTAIGQTSSTAITLPTDFLCLSHPFIYVDTVRYYGVPFDDKAIWSTSPNRFFINAAASTLSLCGTQNKVTTISIPYVYAQPDITLSTSPIWPTQFHSLIPLWMTVRAFPIDASEKDRSWFGEWTILLERGLDRMRDWDARLKSYANSGMSPSAEWETSTGIELSNM